MYDTYLHREHLCDTQVSSYSPILTHMTRQTLWGGSLWLIDTVSAHFRPSLSWQTNHIPLWVLKKPLCDRHIGSEANDDATPSTERLSYRRNTFNHWWRRSKVVELLQNIYIQHRSWSKFNIKLLWYVLENLCSVVECALWCLAD